jgi:hypothetical protein
MQSTAVGPGHKCFLASACEHDDTDAAVVTKVVEDVTHLFRDPTVDGVANIWPVYRDDGDTFACLLQQRVVCHAHANAERPVTARPRISRWISVVPSYVNTLSRLFACLSGE